MRAGLLSLLLLLALTGTANADFTNPVLPGNYPDPSVVQVGADFYASATSDRWAPGLPILHSRDLVSWEQIGSVFEQAPAWATGRRFWAPDLSYRDGTYTALYSGLKRPGKFCIGASTATDPAGPWTDQGPIYCPPRGAIDPTLVDREDGTTWLSYKAQGLGGGLYLRQMDPRSFALIGEPTLLVEPDRGFEGGVTEGSTFFKEGSTWYLMYAGGGCCRPPCTYTEAVARSNDLLGPYVKRDEPVLRSGPEWSCPGHGDAIRLADGSLQLLHHAYLGPDLTSRQREGVLSPMRLDADGWPAVGVEGTARTRMSSPLAPRPDAPDGTRFRDRFTTPALLPGWQWVIRRALPRVETGDGRLSLACGATSGLITRQLAAERFSLAVTVLPTTGKSRPALAVRDNGGTLRGIEVTDRNVRTIRRQGKEVRLGPNLRIPRGRAVRLRIEGYPDGNIQAFATTRGGTRPLKEGQALYGGMPTRIALSCRGGGTGVYSDLRLVGDGRSPVAIPAVAPKPRLTGVPGSPLLP